MTASLKYNFINAAGPAGKGQLEALYRQAGWWTKDDEAEEGLLERIIAGSHCFAVCVSGGDIIAMGRAVSDRAYDAYIQDIFVKPEFRGRKVGAEITQMIIQRLLDDGIKWVGLISTPEAKGLYLKLGFQEVNRAAMILKTNGEIQC
jgi:aralkylamine N-acetyltransferase